MPDSGSISSPRNPFTAPDQLTLADVLASIDNDVLLPKRRRRDLRSHLRGFGRALHLQLSEIPANHHFLRQAIKRLHPEQAGCSAKTLQNMISGVLFALDHVGIVKSSRRHFISPLPEWACLQSEITDKYHRMTISRLVQFCSASGILPEHVDDSVSAALLEALRREPIIKKPELRHQYICKAWNTLATTQQSWPRRCLTVPRYARLAYCIPWETVRDSLNKDTEAFLTSLAGTDPFDEHGPVTPSKPRTIITRRFQIKQIVSALVHRGRDSQSIISLACLVDYDTAKEALSFFLERSGGKTSSQISGFTSALQIIAEHWVHVDEPHLKRLKRLCARLRVKQTGLTLKNRERLQRFDDRSNKAAFLWFPENQMAKVCHEDRGGRREALIAQMALAVKLLIDRPIRLGNLVGLSITRHIRRFGRGTVHIFIPPATVKNGEGLEYPLPADSVRLLDAYLQYRTRLVAGPSEWLFPGRDAACHKAPAHFSRQISAAIWEATGLVINVHLTRHIMAKLFLEEKPGQYEVMRRVLAHKRMSSTGIYTGTETTAALRHFDETIFNLREQLTPIGGVTRWAV